VKIARAGWLCVVLLFAVSELRAADASVKVFEEPGFPVADTAALSSAQLHALLPGASFVTAEELSSAVADDTLGLLVLPYGSAFPEDSWKDIQAYLARGGNLLVLGGRPFTRAAYKEEGAWRLRDYSVRFIRELRIDQYQETPGSSGLSYVPNADVVTQLPAFAWQRGFSPIIHLSDSRIDERGGSAGRVDTRIDALAWGMRDGRRLSAPVLQIDHLRGKFAGGRWIFVSADLAAGFADSAGAKEIVASLVSAASRGAEEFLVRPVLPLYLPEEPVELQVSWMGTHGNPENLSVRVTVTPEDAPGQSSVYSAKLTAGLVMTVPPQPAKGFHIVDAVLLDGEHTIAKYHSGFWMRDSAYLSSGPKLGVNQDYFELNGKPLAVVGTTYMSSEVQRLYFDHPNVYVWDRDMKQLEDAGMNMLRTGWWSGWDKVCDENGVPYERSLRTLEAYLMTARKHGLPVQFNVFAFLPDVLGGENAYLDPRAVRREKNLYSALAARFGDVPFLAWDLINEPSFSQHLWTAMPNGDALESGQWNAWLKKKYSSRRGLESAWNIPPGGDGPLPVPAANEYQGARDGAATGFKLYDFYLFSQEKFAGWVAQIRESIRAAGSQQLITVGQDEGGNESRLFPAYFGGSVDFTTNHSWYENDNLLWDSLIAKQRGKPMLIQETGVGAGASLDGIARRSLENQSALLERKAALSFAQGTGFIEWLWNSNADMMEDGEVSLGGLRADQTEKPEAAVMRGFAAFSKEASNYLRQPEQPDVAIVTSEAAQFSPMSGLQMEAQRKAVRALCYQNRIPGYIVSESQAATLRNPKLRNPRLVILPSPQALNESTWLALLAYVNNGGNLLVTGAVNRDAQWHVADRLTSAHIRGTAEPLTFKTAAILASSQSIPGPTIPMSFDQNKQNALEVVKFQDGATLEQQAYGKGNIYWSAYPVELAESAEAATKLYSYVLGKAGVAPMFQFDPNLSPGVLIYPTVLQDAVTYIFVSEDAAATKINIKDKLTGARLVFDLPSQRSVLVVLRKTDGALLAKYGY
jgi:hypothetical protein